MHALHQLGPASARPIGVQAAFAGKRVLLTGATGFLAKVVLEKLIRDVPGIGKLVLVIRPGRHGSARERFDSEIASSSIFDTLRAADAAWLARFFRERIECVAGELAEPCFGLPMAAFAALAARVDIVINAAASVNFREPLDAALAINTSSIMSLAALARAAHAPLIQVSTCYVNGYNRGELHENVVHPKGRDIEWDIRGFYNVRPLLLELEGKIARLKAAERDPARQQRRLTELGLAEAHRHGWNDTYTFTKWMGEQLALSGMVGRGVTIVRPSIIESTLQEPAPGWIEGVKVADALILAYARGKTRFFPARTEEIIDIIPADLVANSIVLAAAEALAEVLADPGLPRIYQACSGSRNPITLGAVVDLIQAEARSNWQRYERLFYRAPTHAFTTVRRSTFRIMLRAMRLAAHARNLLQRAVGGTGDPAALEALRTTEALATTFSFYTSPRYRFHNTQLLALAQRFCLADQQVFAVDPLRFDWADYLGRIHLAGLNRYALRARAPVPAPATSAPPMAVAAASRAA